jgi:hypothetical protein
MAAPAKWLPIAFIPEEVLISTVGEDMIHNSGWYKFSIALALQAKRISAQISLSGCAPFGVITTG